VGQVVAIAFGLAAASFFPVIVLGIFSVRTNKQGAVAGMLSGILFTMGYVVWFLYLDPWIDPDRQILPKLFGIEVTGIGTVGMFINLAVTLVVSRFTPPPPQAVQDNVLAIRYPRVEGAFHPDQESHERLDE